jgi:hypothetical protein
MERRGQLIKLTRVFNKQAECVKNRKNTNIKFLLILLSIGTSKRFLVGNIFLKLMENGGGAEPQRKTSSSCEFSLSLGTILVLKRIKKRCEFAFVFDFPGERLYKGNRIKHNVL